MSRAWFEAVERGDLDAVHALLGGIEVNERDGRGRLPLTLAARHGHLEVARALLAAGADVNAGPAPRRRGGMTIMMPPAAAGSKMSEFLKGFAGTDGIRVLGVSTNGHEGPEVHEMTPLEAAVEGGHTDMARLLLEAGAGKDGSALGRACELGHEAVVKLLLDAGANVGGSIDSPPLLQAAGFGHAGIVRLLLDRGGDPNEVYEDDETALLSAAAGGYLDAVRLLVERGAKVDARREGENALYRAAANGHREVFDFLAPLSADRKLRKAAEMALKEHQRPQKEDRAVESLIEAAMLGNLQKVEAAIVEGIDPDAIGHYGNAALMYAANYGHVAVIRALLAAGAKPDVRATEDGFLAGGTALMFAAGSGFINNHAEVIQLLAEAGAELEARDARGRTALHHAAERTTPNALRTLLDLRADPNARDAEGATALGILRTVDVGTPAAYRRIVEPMIELLESFGAKE